MAKGIVIGKEERSYIPKDGGETKVARTLYVIWDSPRREEDGFSGRRVESVYCGFACDDVVPGTYCDFEYEIRATSKGSMARLSDIEVIGDTNIVLEILPKK